MIFKKRKSLVVFLLLAFSLAIVVGCSDDIDEVDDDLVITNIYDGDFEWEVPEGTSADVVEAELNEEFSEVEVELNDDDTREVDTTDWELSEDYDSEAIGEEFTAESIFHVEGISDKAEATVKVVEEELYIVAKDIDEEIESVNVDFEDEKSKSDIEEQLIDEIDVELSNGETKRVELDWHLDNMLDLDWDSDSYNKDEIGSHLVKASFGLEDKDLTGEVETKIIVGGVEGSHILIDSLAVDPEVAIEGDSIKLTVDVENFGDYKGDLELRLEKDDEEVFEEEKKVYASSTRTFSLDHLDELEAGDYTFEATTDQDSDILEFEILESGVIYGTVNDTDGDPVSGYVEVESKDYDWSYNFEIVEGHFGGIVPAGELNVETFDESREVGVEHNEEKEINFEIDIAAVDDEDAKVFAENIKDHGVDLYDLGQQEADNVEAHFKNDVIPYTQAIGGRLMEIQNVMEVVFSLETPGEYEVDLDKLEVYEKWSDEYRERDRGWVEDQFDDYYEYEDQYWDLDLEERQNYEDAEDYYFTVGNDYYDSYQDYINEARDKRDQAKDELIVVEEERDNYSELDTWDWELSFADSSEEVTVKVTNPGDIIEENITEKEDYKGYNYDEFKIDFTEAEFEYNHTDGDNEDFDWSLVFDLDTDIEETVSYYDEWEDEWEYNDGDTKTMKEIRDFEYIIPRKATANLEGTMTDSREYHNDDKPLPEIGVIDIDANVDFDLEDSKQIVYDGSFDSEEINYEGRTEINFKEVPSYQDTFDSLVEENFEYLPLIDDLKIDAEWSTSKVTVDTADGDDVFYADFTSKEVRIDDRIVDFSMPTLIEFNGRYQSYFAGEESTLIGGITIEPDYETVDLTEQDWDTEDNYIGGIVSLDGSLDSADFYKAELDISVERDAYDELSSDFRYDFDDGLYIDGEASIIGDYVEVTAYNEQNLEIILRDEDYYEGDMTIGEIRGADETIYAYIRKDNEPYFEFPDGEIKYLLPDVD